MIIPAIERRRASRALSSEPIPDTDLREILTAGTLAPSCYNNQPWRVVVARGGGTLPKVKEALAEGNAWARNAPVILALATRACDDCRLDEGRDYAHFDLGLLAMNLMLQATELGYVAHPIAGFNPKKVRTALGIPKDYDVVTLIIIGKPGQPENLEEWQMKAETSPRERKMLEDVAFFEKWPEG